MEFWIHIFEGYYNNSLAPIEIFDKLRGIHKPCGHGRGVYQNFYTSLIKSKIVHKGEGGGSKCPKICPHGL